MQLDMPVIDMIKRRSSIRTYQKTQIASKNREVLQTFLQSHTIGPLRSASMRFELIVARPGDTEALKRLKTYGMIKNPAGFIVGAMEDSSAGRIEDYGYAMELIILQATVLNLGTCWLGGTFKKSSFAKTIGLKVNETLPAVASVGVIPGKRALKDRLIRAGIKADKRRPWSTLFFDESFDKPLLQHQAGGYAASLEMTRLAPSAANKQPWRIVKARDSNTFHFYLQRDPKYLKQLHLLKSADLQRIDMGIAMCHFELTAGEKGLSGTWQVADPNSMSLPANTEYIVTWAGAPGEF